MDARERVDGQSYLSSILCLLCRSLISEWSNHLPVQYKSKKEHWRIRERKRKQRIHDGQLTILSFSGARLHPVDKYSLFQCMNFHISCSILHTYMYFCKLLIIFMPLLPQPLKYFQKGIAYFLYSLGALIFQSTVR